MNPFKKYLSLLLVLSLVLSAFSACGKKAEPAATEAAPAETTADVVAETEAPAEEIVSDGHYHVGDKIDDFTVTTFDGKEVTLYEVLEEKDMVLLNLWATFCIPCGQEFPPMQEAYAQYQDKVEIIALSTDPTDSDEVLAEYVQKKGMTFPVTRDTVGLQGRILSNGIPTSIVVDRFGTICVIQAGNATDPSVFTNVFDIYTAEDYTESVFMPNLHAKLPEVQPADPAQLNGALNGEGGNLVFTNDSNPFIWPMTVEEKDGRTVASASNVDVPWSQAVVETQVEAKAGEALAMDYKLSSDYSLSVLRITVDDVDVKVTNLQQDWNTFAYQFEESGAHKVTVRFERSINENEGKEGLWIDSIRLISGDEAAEIQANKPKYPVSDELRFELLNENVEIAAIVMEETGDLLLTAPICKDPVLRIAVELDETMDPESAYVSDFAGKVYPLASFVNGDGYLVEIPHENTSGYRNSTAVLYCNGVQAAQCLIFADLEQADVMAQEIAVLAGLPLKAALWDESMVLPEMPQGDGTYTVTYVDQNGDPVPGVMCQVCDESTCQVFVSDENGVCEFTLAVGTYEIHTLKVPAGYEGDTTTVTEAPMGGGELSFTLTKN